MRSSINDPMSYDDARQSLLPKVTHSCPHLNENNALNGRICQRCRTSPLAELKLPEQNGPVSLPHLVNNFGQEQPPKFKLVFVFLAAYLGIGTLLFFLIRQQIKGIKTNGIVDAIYFCVVTMTTVGYGDLVPDSVLAKLLACVFVFTGIALVGLILSRAADYIVEKQEVLLVRAIHMKEQVGPNEILREVETNKVKYKFIMALTFLLVLIIVGTVFLCKVEKLKVIDAFYCVCATITTLGYGDQSFSTKMGRIFAVFWILSSTICLAQFFLYLAELSTESRHKALVKWVLSKRMSFSDFEAADLDHDKVVSPAEFILFELKEMGKISQEDISMLMERFQFLDVDHSGTLTVSDIMLSKQS